QFDQALDLGGCFGTRDGTVATQQGRDDYARMIEAAGAAVKAADPEARVVMGGVVGGAYTDSAGPGCLIDWDPARPKSAYCIFDRYFVKGVMGALIARGSQSRIDWVSIHLFGDNLIGRIARLRQDMLEAGLPQSQLKPIILGEGSYTSRHGTSTSNPEDPFNREQRDYVPKVLSWTAYAGVEAFFWFWLQDVGGSGLGTNQAYGLLDLRGNPKPSYFAYRYFAGLLDGVDRAVKRLSFAEPKLDSTSALMP
ncbi:MAG: hypothetical protein H0V51_20390, partial [Chloroflexi bacterium]|nr:hypothetical protein [Chloroflexota bacterium]